MPTWPTRASGKKAQKALDHPEPGAQDGHHRDVVAQALAVHRLERGLDLDVLDGQLARDLDGHDRRRLEHGLAEVAVARVSVTHHRQAIGQHGVVDHFHHFGHGAMLPSPAMARVNVELKAFDRDPETTASRCLDLGAADAGVLSQRDTYFAARRGRLKLRVEEGALGGELIAYRREDNAEPIESGYVVAAVAAPDELAEALDAALGTVVVVSKRGTCSSGKGCGSTSTRSTAWGALWNSRQCCPTRVTSPRRSAKVDRLRAELGITDDALVSVGYSDLLIDGPQALLRAASRGDEERVRALLGVQGRRGGARRGAAAIYAGANVENVAYPQGQCAEASALGAMVAAGETAITAVAVVAERVDVCPPCGGCRQRLSEFGDAATPVYLGPTTTTLGELLPGAFDRGALA